MPAETHQQGRRADALSVAAFLAALLDVGGGAVGESDAPLTLAVCGVAIEDLGWLWETVCEEFAERSLTTDWEPGDLDLAMTLDEAAQVMAQALCGGGDDGG